MRLFVAIRAPEPIQECLLALPSGLPGADWTDADHYHLTLRFIGEIGRAHAAEIDAALAEVAAPAFELTVAGIDFFQTAGRPRVLWAGVEPSPALTHLARKVESAVVRTELPPETRQFTPHVTLARLRDAPLGKVMEFVRDNALLRAPPFTVDRFTLFESRQGNGGPAYIPLADYPLSVSALTDINPEKTVPKAYWIATYRSISNPDAMAEYAKLALPAIVDAGGRFIARGLPVATKELGMNQRTVLVEFDSVALALAAYDSPAYQKALAVLGPNSAERDIRVVEAAE